MLLIITFTYDLDLKVLLNFLRYNHFLASLMTFFDIIIAFCGTCNFTGALNMLTSVFLFLLHADLSAVHAFCVFRIIQ